MSAAAIVSASKSEPCFWRQQSPQLPASFVIGVFLVADLVCATAVLPVFLGLMIKDNGFIAAPTELGAFMGILSGFAAVLVNGKIIGFDRAVNSITGEVIASGPFSYFWLNVPCVAQRP